MEKTEYMIEHKKFLPKEAHRHLEMGIYKFKRVKGFKYLGTLITQNNEIQEEIKTRIQAGNRYYFGLSMMFKSRNFSKNLKLQLI